MCNTIIRYQHKDEVKTIESCFDIHSSTILEYDIHKEHSLVLYDQPLRLKYILLATENYEKCKKTVSMLSEPCNLPIDVLNLISIVLHNDECDDAKILDIIKKLKYFSLQLES